MLVLLSGLLALLGSELVIQTHRHPLAAQAGFVPTARDAGGGVALGDPCALCEALVAFEPFVASADPLLLQPAAEPAPAPFRSPPSSLQLPRRAPAWRSRAPPHSAAV